MDIWLIERAWACARVDGHFGLWPSSWILSPVLNSDSLHFCVSGPLHSQPYTCSQRGMNRHAMRCKSARRREARKGSGMKDECKEGVKQEARETMDNVREGTREWQNEWKEGRNIRAVAGEKRTSVALWNVTLFNSLGANDYAAVLNVIRRVKPFLAGHMLEIYRLFGNLWETF